MQENLEELKKEKKKRIHQMIVFVIAAIAVIIALCIAWFVSNTRVRGTGATVSADMKNVELKTHGSAGEQMDYDFCHSPEFFNNRLSLFIVRVPTC